MAKTLIEKQFDKLFFFIGKKRIFFLILFFLVIAVSLTQILRQDFVNDISIMLPDTPELRRSLDFINNSDMSDTIAFSITLKHESDTDLSSLTDQFADKLKTSEFITQVVTGIENLNITEIKRELALLIPLFTSKDEYNLFNIAENQELLSRHVRQMFIMITTPGSSFLQSSFGIDPFGWSNPMLEKLKILSKSLGFNVELENNHFVDKTHKNYLIIAKTCVKVTDASKSETLLSDIEKIIQSFPALEITTVCGHKHTLSNQRVVKRDIYITTIIITLSFILLMLFTFRTFDALSIFILPFFAIILSVFISGFILQSLSFFMVGFAAVIAGISVDYGIHLFTAFKTRGYDRFKSTVKPVIIASMSTMGVFVSFFISSVKGYRELAVFSILSIVICVILSILFLPHFWIKKNLITRIKIPSKLSRNKSRLVLTLWVVILFLSINCMLKADFLKATDISAFDGSEQKVFDAEAEFYGIWGGERRPAVIVTRGKDLQKAWQDYEEITNKLKDKIDGFNSFALVLPSLKQQKINLRNFKKFWNKNKIKKFKKDFLIEISSYGFKPDTFNNFFTMLNAENISFSRDIPEVLNVFEKHFVQKKDGSLSLISYFIDTKENLLKARTVLDDYPGSFVVSRRQLSSQIGKQLIIDLKKISLFAIVWILILIVILLRKAGNILLSLLPVITSITFVFLVLNLLAIEVSAIILITLIIILGLSLDYGVFISSAGNKKELDSVIIATTFSMLTSLMGAGALIFAFHPVMFSIGITIVSGVLAAYLSAVFCIPAFKRIMK